MRVRWTHPASSIGGKPYPTIGRDWALPPGGADVGVDGAVVGVGATAVAVGGTVVGVDVIVGDVDGGDVAVAVLVGVGCDVVDVLNTTSTQ